MRRDGVHSVVNDDIVCWVLESQTLLLRSKTTVPGPEPSRPDPTRGPTSTPSPDLVSRGIPRAVWQLSMDRIIRVPSPYHPLRSGVVRRVPETNLDRVTVKEDVGRSVSFSTRSQLPRPFMWGGHHTQKMTYYLLSQMVSGKDFRSVWGVTLI